MLRQSENLLSTSISDDSTAEEDEEEGYLEPIHKIYFDGVII